MTSPWRRRLVTISNFELEVTAYNQLPKFSSPPSA